MDSQKTPRKTNPRPKDVSGNIGLAASAFFVLLALVIVYCLWLQREAKEEKERPGVQVSSLYKNK